MWITDDQLDLNKLKNIETNVDVVPVRLCFCPMAMFNNIISEALGQ